MKKPLLETILCCKCGSTQLCEDDREIAFGGYYQCNSCSTVWVKIRPRRGGDAWIKVSEGDVRFHRLLDEVSEDE